MAADLFWIDCNSKKQGKKIWHNTPEICISDSGTRKEFLMATETTTVNMLYGPAETATVRRYSNMAQHFL